MTTKSKPKKIPFSIAEIWKYSWQEAINSRAIRLLGVTGLAVIITLTKNINELLKINNYGYTALAIFIILLIYLALIYLYFVIFHFYPRYTKHHNSLSSYGFLSIELKEAFSVIHGLRSSNDYIDLVYHDKMPENNYSEAVKAALTFLCKKISSGYGKVNKAACSVSIKLPVKGTIEAAACVNNICRSEDNSARDIPSYTHAEHSVIGNSAYQRIFKNYFHNNNNKLYYLNNDIKSSEYESTSIGTYAKTITDLPYESELVVPIVPFYQFQSNKKPTMIGFLCVDCDKTGGFNEKYVPFILQGVSEGISDIVESLHKYHQLTSK